MTDSADSTTHSQDEAMSRYWQHLSRLFDGVIRDSVLDKVMAELGAVTQEGGERLQTESQRLADLLKGVRLEPARLLESQLQLFRDQSELWQQAALGAMGVEQPDLIQEVTGDARFADSAWRQNPMFRFLKQSYLLNARFLESLADQVAFEDAKKAEQFRFVMRQMASAMAPTNFANTNPEVYRAVVASGGESLARGFQNFLNDLASSPPEGFRISHTDADAFTVGQDLAVTPGAVVYRNELMELIQYESVGDRVYRTPILFVPAMINKYYILDLTPEKSMIAWLVGQGYTVFALSWINPGPELADTTLMDYMHKGPLTALDVIEAITGERQIHAAGYCIGGTLLAITLAYLGAIGRHTVASATYFATLLDFEEPGEMGVYLSPELLEAVEVEMADKGFLDGRRLALGFNLLREQSLFWPYYINNYLKGETPQPLDLLFWNADSTNVPHAACRDYLHHLYQGNEFARGGLDFDGKRLFLQAIEAPSYFVSPVRDHLAPWTSCYRGARCHGGSVRFVLAGSGHIAGIINPPTANKYGYWTNEALPRQAEAWQSQAIHHEGSWWNDWLGWLKSLGTDTVSARRLGNDAYPVLEPAPGRYVHKSCR